LKNELLLAIVVSFSIFILTADNALAQTNSPLLGTAGSNPQISINNSGTTTVNAQPATSTQGTSNNQTGNNTLIPVPLWNIAPSLRISLAFVFSFIVIGVILYSASILIRRARRSHPDIKTSFWDIIREQDWYPSLAIFQFLVWTVVIIFAFLGIYLIRIFGGVLEAPSSISPNILALMGISVAVPIISGGISRNRYFGYTTTTAAKKPPTPLPPLSTMLEENKKPVLTRFQMFGWTWIGILIYIAILFSTPAMYLMDKDVAETCQTLRPNDPQFGPLHCDHPLRELNLPDIDPTLVVLMGLSQGAYLGGKIISTPTMKIEKVVLGKREDNAYVLTIYGNNFGESRDTVWFDSTQIRDPTKLLVWETDGSRIDALLGNNKPEEGEHTVRVAKGSLIVEKRLKLEKEQFKELEEGNMTGTTTRGGGTTGTESGTTAGGPTT
jgi:hypothetical protein